MKGKRAEISDKSHLLKIGPPHYAKEFQYMTAHPWFIHSFAACVRNNFHRFSPKPALFASRAPRDHPELRRWVKMRQHCVVI